MMMPGSQSKFLLEEIATWEEVTTIIVHGGCVFEFKGPFPKGVEAEGFYNLQGDMPGFHGHLNLDRIDHIRFQDKQHRGRQSYAYVFEDADNAVIFKIFLGRDLAGQLFTQQVERFQAMQQACIESNDNE